MLVLQLPRDQQAPDWSTYLDLQPLSSPARACGGACSPETLRFTELHQRLLNVFAHSAPVLVERIGVGLQADF